MSLVVTVMFNLLGRDIGGRKGGRERQRERERNLKQKQANKNQYLKSFITKSIISVYIFHSSLSIWGQEEEMKR